MWAKGEVTRQAVPGDHVAISGVSVCMVCVLCVHGEVCVVSVCRVRSVW